MAVTLNVGNPMHDDKRSGPARNVLMHAKYSPFALPVHLVLGECDILVVNVDPKVERDLAQILISRPL